LNVIELDHLLLDTHCICILSLRGTSKALEAFIDRSHIAIWYWIQEFNPYDVFPSKKKSRIIAFVIDETMIQIGDTDAWLWVAVEPIHYRILGVYISRHRNMLVAESFIKSLIKLYGKHIVYLMVDIMVS
jgi:putative transposase